jgi:hypothetical protein
MRQRRWREGVKRGILVYLNIGQPSGYIHQPIRICISAYIRDVTRVTLSLVTGR